MKVNQVVALLLFSSTINGISLNKKLSMYSKDDEPVEQGVEENLLNSNPAPKGNPEDITDVSEKEMEEYANKLHDKAGAEKMFTDDNQ